MTKHIMKFISFALSIALSIPAVCALETNENGEVMIRVGLASASSHNPVAELEAAHLQNNDGFGSGFRFGYYDDARNFVELSRTDAETKEIAVLKTQNLYYGYVSEQGKNTYSSSIVSDIAVGCYHVRIPGFYATYEDALRDAQAYGGFVAWVNNEYQVRIGAYQSREGAEGAVAALGQGEIVGTSAYGMNVVATGGNQILFQFDNGEGTALAVLPDVTESTDVRTWYSGYKYRGGFQYQRVSGGNLTVVNVLPLEEYIKGVICYEMGRLWPIEALKTQAICARTYALRNLNTHRSLGFDVCNTASCQAYYGMGSNREDYGPSEISDQAVEETRGQVLTYNGELAATYYSSCHGGASEEIANVWTSNKVGAFPYLSGVLDPYEETIADLNPYSKWTVSYSKNELTQRLRSKGYGTGHSLDRLELTYSPLGNVIKIVAVWENGQQYTFSPNGNSNTNIRGVFGLNSIHFTVNGVMVHEEVEETPVLAGYMVNGAGLLESTEGLYVMTADGMTQAAASEEIHVINGEEEVLPLVEDMIEASPGTNVGGGTVVVTGDSFVFEGGGLGHQLGMSQFGANAMARLGFTYEEICKFYYPGTEFMDMSAF